MAKLKLNDFKKYLAEFDEKDLRAELLKLFSKLPQVQEFYTQELLSPAERKAMLDAYKKKVYDQFWTRGGNPKQPVSNATIRRLLSDFEKVAVEPYEVVDLLLYRVEVATSFANQFGGMADADYNAAHTAFQKAVKMMAEHDLHDYFKIRCEELFRHSNLDYWYIEWLQDAWQEQFDR
jgi:hypothetical protein